MKVLLWKAMSWNPFVKFRKDQSAIGTLEVMLIIAVIIILFIIFRKYIVDLINGLMDNATTDIQKYNQYDDTKDSPLLPSTP